MATRTTRSRSRAGPAVGSMPGRAAAAAADAPAVGPPYPAPAAGPSNNPKRSAADATTPRSAAGGGGGSSIDDGDSGNGGPGAAKRRCTAASWGAAPEPTTDAMDTTKKAKKVEGGATATRAVYKVRWQLKSGVIEYSDGAFDDGFNSIEELEQEFQDDLPGGSPGVDGTSDDVYSTPGEANAAAATKLQDLFQEQRDPRNGRSTSWLAKDFGPDGDAGGITTISPTSNADGTQEWCWSLEATDYHARGVHIGDLWVKGNRVWCQGSVKVVPV